MRFLYPLLRFLALTWLLTGCGVAVGQSTARPVAVQPTATPFTLTPTPVRVNPTQVSIPASCPVTRPQTPVFMPLPPYAPTSPYPTQFWYGSNELWTMVRHDGMWRQLPKDDHGYSQKLVWWRYNYDWIDQPDPTLRVTGRRLDSKAPPMDVPNVTNGHHPDVGWFGLVGVGIPTLGCWEITGKMGTATLTYVVWVAE